jgi:hypothetical protein
MTRHAQARPDLPQQHPLACPSAPDVPRSDLTWSPVTSSEHLEPVFQDRTHQLATARTQAESSPLMSMRTKATPRHITMTGPGNSVSPQSSPIWLQGLVIGSSYASLCVLLSGHMVRVRSLPRQSLVPSKLLLFISNLHHPCSQVLTTKCVTNVHVC